MSVWLFLFVMAHTRDFTELLLNGDVSESEQCRVLYKIQLAVHVSDASRIKDISLEVAFTRRQERKKSERSFN